MEGLNRRPATAEEAAICDRESGLLSAVREAIAAARALERRPPGNDALALLRDEYAEAGEADRPAVLAQMAQEAARGDALRPKRLPDLAAPYFGHMRLRSAGRSRDVLLGDCPFVDADRGVSIIDWRRAPLAEVFFACDPGDDYEIEAGGRTIAGVLEDRRVVAFEAGELAAISVDGGSLRPARDRWVFEPGGIVPSLAAPAPAMDGGGSDRRAFRLAGLLDKTQAALLEQAPEQPLLVLGSAGCGKTTVALHRAAALFHRDPKRFAPERSLVVVPEPGLRRFAERILIDLGVPCVLDEESEGDAKARRSLRGATVRTFDDWIRAEARRVFPRLPGREPPDPPFAVSRLKRHPAMLAAIDRLIDDLALAAADRVDRWLNGRGSVASAVVSRAEPILADRLRGAEMALLKSAPPARRDAIKEAFRVERRRLTHVRADHLRLVGDRDLLAHAVRASAGELPMSLVEEVAEHTGRQLDQPSEIRFAHVDADRLATLDGRSLDDGTPEAVAGTIDLEDYALLFEIFWRKTGRSRTRAGELSSYAHLVLDEAQELTPVELRILGRAVEPSGSITVAGDAAQRIDRSGYFASWEAAMAALGTRASPAYLETSYRCPAPIVDFAHAILGADAPPERPRATRGGAPVERAVLPGEGPAAAALIHALRDLVRRDPEAGVALLARDGKAARALHEVVSRALPARLIEDGNFAFGPGIEVTEVAHVKGLEFDYVVVPDADAKSYPDTPENRRLLHVAATRASRRLWILSPGRPSPILPG
jgi:DNA helicase-2/ATP-dependent DNA helicase PcrA